MFLIFEISTYADNFKKTTYTMSGDGGWSIQFCEDNQIKVSRADAVATEGTYTIKGDQIEILDKSGPMSCGGETLGKYQWHLEDRKLTFTLVADECEGRVQALTSQSWIEKGANK
jgi:hypothetical protein